MGNFLDVKNTYIIAEVGNNHNGDMSLMYQLIDAAKDAGVNCVKFQMRDLKSLYREQTLDNRGDDLGAEYILDLLRKFDMTIDQHAEVKKYVEKIGLDYLCTPWDIRSLENLIDLNVKQLKLASADFQNIFLIDQIIKTKIPFILSTGMNTESDIDKVINYIKKSECQEYGILHCNSTYPAPFEDLNLNFLKSLKKKHENFGYSGHERGIYPSLAAVGLGAKIIERHITLDRNMEGPDHAASLEPHDFKELVYATRIIEKSLGVKKKLVSQGELINRENLGKSLVAKKDIKSNTLIQKDHIDIKSPGLGLSPFSYKELIGKKIKRDVNKDDYFLQQDLEDKTIVLDDLKMNRPWGIPVRYHDFELLYEKFEKLEFVEFHLSYADLNRRIADFFTDKHDIGFTVHAPELFEESSLLDLCSSSKKYRRFSVDCMKRVIEVTRELKNYFPKENIPKIITNIGGYSMDAPLKEGFDTLYANFTESINELDTEGVEILPQTNAPFPWHFGGQRYQNLMLDSISIKRICEENNLRICLDVSHSALFCNHTNLDILEFIQDVGEYVAHLHISDSKGTNGEGLQVGDGSLNFSKIFNSLDIYCPQVSFIPEIWQGHKNNGSGFKFALNKFNEVQNGK